MRVLRHLQRKTWLSNYLQDQSDSSAWGASMSKPYDKKSQVPLIMPAWVSLALQIYQMKLIGNTLGLRSRRRVCQESHSCCDSLTACSACSLGGGRGSHFRRVRRHIERWMVNNKHTSFTRGGACPLTRLNMCWGFINLWGLGRQPDSTASLSYRHTHTYLLTYILLSFY